MIRGTTAQFKFDIPYDFSELQYINIVAWQEGNPGPSETRKLPIVLKYDAAGDKSAYIKWESENKYIVVTLDPEMTARFMDDKKATIQMSATTRSGFRFASPQQVVTVYPIYEGMEFSDADVVPMPEDDGIILFDGGIVTI